MNICFNNIYSGSKDLVDENEKSARRELKLPITKQLIYYKELSNPHSLSLITQYRIVEEYSVSNPWWVLEILLEDGSSHFIHSSFLGEMQKPSFFSDMENQAKSL